MYYKIKRILWIMCAAFIVFCGVWSLRTESDIVTERIVSSRELLVPNPDGGVLEEIVPGDKININTANKAELSRLSGIGSVLSQRIIDYREEYGGFKTADELMKVYGIGDKIYGEVCDYITVEG